MADQLRNVGVRLRAVRQERGLTLDELSSRAGMSASTLSRLESGKRQASLELLLPVTRLLGIRIDDLLDPEPVDPRVSRPVIRRDGMIIAPLAAEGSPIHTYRIAYPPSDAPPELRVHDGYEWLYVVSGRIRLRLGELDLTIARGEAAEFDTRVPHSVSAAGSRPAVVFSIFNEAGARMHTHSA